MLDPESLRTSKARGLMTTSAFIAVYVIAGGEITEQATILGGTVKIDRPYVLELAGFVLFLYMLIRFLFPWEDVADPVIMRARKYLHRRRSFKEHVLTCGRDTYGDDKNVAFSGRQKNPQDRTRLNAWRSGKGEWVSSVSVDVHSNAAGQIRTVVLDANVVRKCLIRPVLWVAFMEDEGRENIWPLVLGVAALLLGSVRVLEVM